ncbi:16S rRNA (cytidine(1402)-2'-O)-methyltransferase [bacterium]|nr:16S rRNA (cytidine(1402)-2'-O)-methyltransferase [bacterium]
MQISKLYIVSTPIGNFKDITIRALNALKQVDLILCEDTRTTKKLLVHYQIKKPLLSYHHHSSQKRIDEILTLLRKGKNLALVSDAGTPGISDPGNLLIQKVIEQLDDKVKIVPIPGPSAIICAASVSGFPMDRFLFMGFLPAKKKRRDFFREISQARYPVIFYESPHRILRTLKELRNFLENLDGRYQLVVCRELTKKFETVYRGGIDEVVKKIENDKIKGEFVVICRKNSFRK